MRVTTTYTSRKGSGASIIVAKARRGKHTFQKTLPYDQRLGAAENHGLAAAAIVDKVAPGYRRVEIRNSAKVISWDKGKTVWEYKD